MWPTSPNEEIRTVRQGSAITERNGMSAKLIKGRLATGIGQGRHFTRLDWARRQFIDKLGIDPFPGTVNLLIEDPADLESWRRFRESPGIRIDNPGNGPHDCDARCYPIRLAGRIDAAIVLPEVEGYPANQVEVIAALNVREALCAADGDEIEFEVR
jgi:CTP-dependent riboflavin kinase